MATKTILKLSKIDKLISEQKTGTPKELAQKLKISERYARHYINILRDLGAPIAYSRKQSTYFYKEDGFFLFRFTKISEEKALY